MSYSTLIQSPELITRLSIWLLRRNLKQPRTTIKFDFNNVNLTKTMLSCWHDSAKSRKKGEALQCSRISRLKWGVILNRGRQKKLQSSKKKRNTIVLIRWFQRLGMKWRALKQVANYSNKIMRKVKSSKFQRSLSARNRSTWRLWRRFARNSSSSTSSYICATSVMRLAKCFTFVAVYSARSQIAFMTKPCKLIKITTLWSLTC